MLSSAIYFQPNLIFERLRRPTLSGRLLSLPRKILLFSPYWARLRYGDNRSKLVHFKEQNIILG
jgi:hypothetical protein